MRPRSNHRASALTELRSCGHVYAGVVTPHVTVIIAVMNGEDYLEHAISSVVRQTLSAWHLIVVDDGSSDATAEIARRWVARDERITSVRQENAGVAAARNRGLALATTRWVAFLDHDDAFLPEKLEKQVHFLESHPQTACLSTWGYKIGSRGRVLGTYELGPATPGQFASWREDGRLIVLVTASVIVDRDVVLALGGFRNEPGGTEDVDLWSRIADEHVIQTLPEHLMHYRVHAGSVSANKLHMQRLNSERIRQNALLRRSNLDEIGLKEFLQAWEGRPESEKRLARRITLSLALFRHGGGLLADRNPSGLWFLLRSAWLRPRFVLDRLLGSWKVLRRSAAARSGRRST